MSQYQLQDYRPLTQTLEWQLADVHWSEAGVAPFTGNQVPYFINNSGRLSQCAAEIFHAACAESDADRPDPLWILELGAGSGLFARQFLDCLRDLCQQHGTPFYDRVRYLVTDRSARTVQDWGARGLFTDHGEHALCGTCDALNPTHVALAGGGLHPLADVRAVFLNYLLDNLPASVLVRDAPADTPGGAPGPTRELRVRTNLIRDPEVVRQYTTLDLAELRRLADSADSAQRSGAPSIDADRARLVPLLTLFEPEVALQPVDPAAVPYGVESLAALPDQRCLLVSHGALRCLQGCLPVLAPRGLVLVNDYGPVQPGEVAHQTAPLRFGSTMALGINFLLLDALLGDRCQIITPSADAGRMIHARLLLCGDQPAAAARFEQVLGDPGYEHLVKPAEDARQLVMSGRLEEALEAYRIAVERCPRDWWIAGELAELLGSHLRDVSGGLEAAQAALSLNPWYSGWLWNIFGDCLFGLGRFHEAHAAYERAYQIDPTDARTNLNLSYTLSQRGQLGEALHAIARGLSRDRGGGYRARLLDKQQHILAALSSQELSEQERQTRRTERLRCDRLLQDTADRAAVADREARSAAVHDPR